MEEKKTTKTKRTTTKKTTTKKKKETSYKDDVMMKDEIKYSPEPTYFFNVGDSVVVGSLVSPVVSEIYEDGKVYKIDFINIDKKTGETEKCSRYFMWYEVRPVETDTNSMIKADQNMRLNYSQRVLDSLLTISYSFGCDTSPSYQREYVWTQEDKEALIDSIFRGIDIGKFVFVHLEYAPNSVGYEVLDGKQRLKTITDFYENRFPYKGKYYNDLCHKDKSYFRQYNISYAELSDTDYETKLYTFISLNTRGKVLDNSQIEYAKALYKKETGKDFDEV